MSNQTEDRETFSLTSRSGDELSQESLVLHPRAGEIIYPVRRHEDEIAQLIESYRVRVNKTLLGACDPFGLITIRQLNVALSDLLYTVGQQPTLSELRFLTNDMPNPLVLTLISTHGSRIFDQDGGLLHIDAAFSGKTAVETYMRAYTHILLKNFTKNNSEFRRQRKRKR